MGSPDHIWVSIDGVGKVHDEIRRVEGCYDKAVKGIEKALAAGISVGVSYCIGERNYGNLVETAEVIRDLGVKEMVFNHLNFTDRGAKDIDTEVLWAQIQNLMRGTLREDRFEKGFISILPDYVLQRDLNRWYLSEPPGPMGDHKCRVAWKGIRILPNGDAKVAFRCGISPVMGNVFEEGFMNVWNGKRYRAFREMIREKGSVEQCYRCCSLFG